MFDDLITAAASRYNVPAVWVYGVIGAESDWNPDAYRSTSPRDTSWGLMQLTLPTAQALGFTGDPNELFDPETNIDLGTKLLGQLRARYGDDVQAVYSAYNSGSGSNYLSNSTVAAHVARFMTYLQDAITNAPVLASSGAAGLLVAVVLMWWYSHKGGKK